MKEGAPLNKSSVAVVVVVDCPPESTETLTKSAKIRFISASSSVLDKTGEIGVIGIDEGGIIKVDEEGGLVEIDGGVGGGMGDSLRSDSEILWELGGEERTERSESMLRSLTSHSLNTVKSPDSGGSGMVGGFKLVCIFCTEDDCVGVEEFEAGGSGDGRCSEV